MATEGDPFACFDNDDTAGDGIKSQDDDTPESTAPKRRDAECGVLAFHAGTERALLAYVENRMASRKEGEKASSFVLQAVDVFCMERHWMMHVGDEKGAILQRFLRQCVSSRNSQDSASPMTVVELGTYCGYSAIMMTQTLLQAGCLDFHIFTVEVNRQHASVAERLIELAEMRSHITVLRREPDCTDLASMLKSHLSSIDFLFIDHDKNAYLPDSLQLEQSGLIVRGTHVAADNVLFHRIDNYRKHMKVLELACVVETQCVKSRLEYCEPDATELNKDQLVDGLELTVYLDDPEDWVAATSPEDYEPPAGTCRRPVMRH